MSLFKRLAADALPSYLSGLVIGEELRCQRLASGDTVIIMGAEGLAARYEQAPGLLGVSCRQVESEASWLGLRAIADTLTAASGQLHLPPSLKAQE